MAFAKKFLLIIIVALAAITLLACNNETKDNVADGVITGLNDNTVIYDLASDYAAKGTVKCGYVTLNYSGTNEQAKLIEQTLNQLMDEYYLEIAGYDEMLSAQNEELTFTHERSYNMVYLDEQYISIIAEGYDMSAGAAHPNTYEIGYVFDLTTGEQVSLAEFLPEGYAAALKDDVVNQIKAAGELDYFYPNLAEAVEIALLSENWYLAEDCIWLIFNPDEIAAYAAGILKFAYYYRG